MAEQVQPIEITTEDIENAVGNLKLSSMDDVIEKMKTNDWTLCISLFSRVEEANTTIKDILRSKLREVYEDRKIIEDSSIIKQNIKNYLALGLPESERQLFFGAKKLKGIKTATEELTLEEIIELRELAKSVVSKIDGRFKRLLDVVYGKTLDLVEVKFTPEKIKNLLSPASKSSAKSAKLGSSESRIVSDDNPIVSDDNPIVSGPDASYEPDSFYEPDVREPIESFISIKDRLAAKHKDAFSRTNILKTGIKELIDESSKIKGVLDSETKDKYLEYFEDCLARVKANLDILDTHKRELDKVKFRIQAKIKKAKAGEEDIDFEFLNVLKEDECLLCLVKKV